MPRYRSDSILGAVAHGSGACCASPPRHLRAGTVGRRGDACPASPCVIPESAQGFLSSNHPGSPVAARRRLEVSSQNGAWSRKDVCRLLPRLAQDFLGAAADRRRPPPQGAGALCQHQGGAGERPPFSTLRARPNEHPSFRCARVSSWLQHIEAAIGLASAGSWQRQGHSHSKPKNLFQSYLSAGHFLCWEEPRKHPR